MTLSFIRALFFLISAVIGYYIGDLRQEPVLGIQIGMLGGLFLIFVETQLRRVSVRGLSSLVFGLILGIIMAKMLAGILKLLPMDDFTLSVSEIILTLVFSYLGAVMALRGKDEFNIIIPYVKFRRSEVREEVILIDTSAIIDGRIADVFKVNFLPGRLVVPRFVLLELQKISDSEDELKRQRGRRGMDLLRSMQNDPQVDIHIHEDDLTEETEVDVKLVRLAKLMDASICTTDFNLGRTASLRGIKVFNLNELSNALRSVVYTGEELIVQLVKEGKEHNQAVAYMDDGTMVVVSDARELIGETVNVVVTSVLQTQAGKMIFAKLEGPANG